MMYKECDYTITLVAVVFEVMATNRNEENNYKP